MELKSDAVTTALPTIKSEVKKLDAGNSASVAAASSDVALASSESLSAKETSPMLGSLDKTAVSEIGTVSSAANPPVATATTAVGTEASTTATPGDAARATSVTASGPRVRPSISSFQDPVEFLKAMIEFRKATERTFSVHESTSKLRKVSPSLVSLVLKRKRKITLDRSDEFAKLMLLNSREKVYFRSWISRIEGVNKGGAGTSLTSLSDLADSEKNRKDVGVHILNDWINVYVKDCFQLPKVQKNPELVYQCLASHAEPQRIKKSMEFLLKEGHLRRTLDGSIVVEANLAVANPQVPSQKIRQFHKGALGVAKSAIDMFPREERMANTLIVPLNEKSYGELVELIQDFSEKLQEFAANNQEPGERLYQFILNLSPTGGKPE